MKSLLLSLVFLASCSYFISSFEGEEYAVIGMKSDQLSLLFSHNISGETHPCGCRTFPLGGLPQVAGQMHELQEAGSELFYVDTGDTFFPSNRLTMGMEESQRFAAKNLAKGLAQLGLKYHVPGDQDFSAGVPFYREILQESGITLLAANAKPEIGIAFKKWVELKRGPHRIFLIGLSDPALLQDQAALLFSDPAIALDETIKEVKNAGWDQGNPHHRLILLSHSGYEQDEVWAKRFPVFDWVIGSHSQKFIRKPLYEGKTGIVQVLSQNHYLGEIKLSFKASKESDQYQIYEIHESLSQKLTPNPYEAFIQAHKTEMTRLQELEQSKQKSVQNENLPPYASAKSCIECHQPQADKWHSTAHSVAYATLINANEAKNLGCVKCHSHGLGDARGFTNSNDITTFEDARKRDDYWKEVEKSFKSVKSIRALPPKRIEKISKDWHKLDERFGVNRQMANVQCLNCHDQHPDHPFHVDQDRPSREEKMVAMKGKCIACHDADQSPEWYIKNEQGLPGVVNNAILDQKIKAIGCPKLEETGL